MKHKLKKLPKLSGHGGALQERLLDITLKDFNDETKNYPRLALLGRQLFDLELLLNGGFSPLEGFMDEKTYESVRDNMRLPDGVVWPMPIVLDVPEDAPYKVGDNVVLTNEYGNPLALMEITSSYLPDKMKEVSAVYGTTDEEHFGVRYVLRSMHPRYIGGPVYGIQFPEYEDFGELRKSPRELREILTMQGKNKIVAFQTRNPIHRAHFELIRRAGEENDAHVLVHPVVGMTKDGDIDYQTRVRSYQKLARRYFKDMATLSLLPLAMRMGGPREALWHAIIRKNYGATHFIIGRDHAGPGKDKNGKLFYEPYDAQELVQKFADEIGMTIIPMRLTVYVEELGKYLYDSEVPKGHTPKEISGTEFRRMLRGKEEVPSWFSFPEVIDELRRSVARQTGYAIFFTGLPSSGKSTTARLLKEELENQHGKLVTLLDGDVVRHHLSKGLGFSHQDRNTNVERIGFVAGEIVKHGGIVICSAIAPFHESRKKNRDRIDNLGTYIEVYMATPVSVCKTRDPKGLYHKAEQGIIKGFTGVDEAYEVPQSPELIIDASHFDPTESVSQIIDYLQKKGLLT